MMLNPIPRMKSMATPRQPPITVPDPPRSDVPPSTAPATARNIAPAPPCRGSPAAGRREQPQNDSEPDRQTGLVRRRDEVHDDRRGRVDVPDREVDLAADQEHHLAGADERDRRHALGDVLDVGTRVERRAPQG